MSAPSGALVAGSGSRPPAQAVTDAAGFRRASDTTLRATARAEDSSGTPTTAMLVITFSAVHANIRSPSTAPFDAARRAAMTNRAGSERDSAFPFDRDDNVESAKIVHVRHDKPEIRHFRRRSEARPSPFQIPLRGRSSCTGEPSWSLRWQYGVDRDPDDADTRQGPIGPRRRGTARFGRAAKVRGGYLALGSRVMGGIDPRERAGARDARSLAGPRGC